MSEPVAPETVSVGVIGLGNMGSPMSANLARKGFRLTVFDLNAAAVERLATEHGARAAASADEVLAASDVVITMLPDGGIVRRALLGDGTIAPPAARLKRGAIVIDMSSSAPVGTRELGAELARLGVTLIDAPVSGGVTRAMSGTLAIIVGGDEAAAARVRPLFDAMGRSVIHVGPLGAGHAMKALNNYVSATGLVAACEAVRVAERFGIEGAKAIEVLNNSTGKNNSTETKLNQFVLSGSFASGFSLGLMRKDLATALDLARGIGAPVLLADSVVKLWTEAEGRLGKQADHTEIDRMLRK